MNRRSFAARISCIIPATWLGLVSHADADVLDLTKKSKAKQEEENHIVVKILGFHGEKLGGSKHFKDITLWSCKYQVKNLDGGVTVRESPKVMSTSKDEPPTKFQIDLS
jgi:hypothetical protein